MIEVTFLLFLMVGGAAAADPTLAQLQALPLSQRQSQDHHFDLARAAHAADQPALAAEAAATATLLLPGPPRDFAAVRQWLATRARQLQARALGLAATQRAQAVQAYLGAVKADGAVLADDDRGLRAEALASLKAAPPDAHSWFELGWFLYFTGENPAAQRAFERARDLEPDPYNKWRDQKWVDRLNSEKAAEAADALATAQREAARRAEDDKRYAAEAADRAQRARRQAEVDRDEARKAARARRHEITLELISLDQKIRTLRERRMIRLTPGSGLDAQSIYNYLSELKAEEDAAQDQKRKLLEERDALE